MNPWLLVFLAVTGGVCVAAGMLLRPRPGGGREMREATDALEDALARATDLVAATRALTRELEKTGADVAGQSAEHLRALKSAVAEADKRLEALTETRPVAGGPVAPAPVAPSPPVAPARAAPPPPPPGRRVDLTVDDDGARPSRGQGRRPDRYEAIYRLADDGITVEDIARQMQMGKGEVQLILSLRRPE